MNAATASPNRLFPVEFQRLNREGYQIVPFILSKSQCKQTISQLHDMFENLRPQSDPLHFDRNLLRTHIPQCMLRAESYGLVVHFGAGHLEPVWRVRENRALVNVFKRIYGYDNDASYQFLSSFQGYTYTPPIEYAASPRYEQVQRFRLDQGVYRPGCHTSVQGFQSLTKAGPRDDTMTVLVGSHHYHAEFVHRFRAPRQSCQRVMLRPHEVEWYKAQKGVREIDVVHDAGDLILWDSRLVYCFKTAEKGRRPPRARIGMNVCMKPASLSHIQPDGQRVAFRDQDLNEIVRRKLNFLVTRRTTSHDPHHGIVYGLLPSHGLPESRLDMTLPPPFPFLSMTPLGQHLAGLGILSVDEEVEVYTNLTSSSDPGRAPHRIRTEIKMDVPPPPPPPPPQSPRTRFAKRARVQDAPPARVQDVPPPSPKRPVVAAVFESLDQQHRVRPTTSKNIVIWQPVTRPDPMLE